MVYCNKKHANIGQKMSSKKLPVDVVINILLFDGRFRVSGGEIINLLDKNKYKDVIHFLHNKPLPNFKGFIYGVREKSYSVDLSHGIHIQYNYKFNVRNEIEGMEIWLWKRYKFLDKVICK